MTEQSPADFIVTVPTDYLIAIGKINVGWGTLESAVDLSIARLAGFKQGDQRSAIVTAHMTWPLKMDILSSLADALAPQYTNLAGFAAVKPLLKKAQDGRNRVAHGQWGFEEGQVYKLRATARGKLRTEISPVALDDLGAIFADIGHAGKALLKVVFNA